MNFRVLQFGETVLIVTLLHHLASWLPTNAIMVWAICPQVTDIVPSCRASFIVIRNEATWCPAILKFRPPLEGPVPPRVFEK